VHAVRARLVEQPREPNITASVGATVTSDSRADPEGLLREADKAMYAAKRAGGNRFRIYDPELRD
jgi:GGDEF domain-containing protein